jgi:hypothetical protein
VVGVLSLLAIPITWKRSQEVWLESPGSVVESYLHEGSRKTRKKRSTSVATTYEVRLRYRYLVADREFTGDARALRQSEDDEDRKQAIAIADGYRAGDALPVFHRPSVPEKSRLTPKEPRLEFVLDVLFGVLFLGCGAIALLLARRLSLRHPREKGVIS